LFLFIEFKHNGNDSVFFIFILQMFPFYVIFRLIFFKLELCEGFDKGLFFPGYLKTGTAQKYPAEYVVK